MSSCNNSSAVAEMGDRLAIIDMDQKVGGCCADFRGGKLGPYLTQCGVGRGLPLYKCHLDPSNRLATIHRRYRQTGQDRQTTVR